MAENSKYPKAPCLGHMNASVGRQLETLEESLRPPGAGQDESALGLPRPPAPTPTPGRAEPADQPAHLHPSEQPNNPGCVLWPVALPGSHCPSDKVCAPRPASQAAECRTRCPQTSLTVGHARHWDHGDRKGVKNMGLGNGP